MSAARAPRLPLGSVARAGFDGAERIAASLARRWPRAALRLAGALGASRNSLSRRWPAPAALAELFGLAPRPAAHLARRIAAQEARNRLVARARGAGEGERLRPLTAWALPPAALPAPAILVTFHVGALPALGLALDELPAPWLATGCGELEPEALGASSAEGVERRTALLARRLAHLRAGGFVVLAADGELGGAVPIPCLGRELPLRRGIFFLAGAAAVPVLPLVALWRPGGRVELHTELGDLLAGGPADERLPAALGDWLTRLLRARPEALTVGLLRRLCGEV